MTNSITTRLIVLLTGCLAAIFAAAMLLDYRLTRTEILERLALQSRETIQGTITDMENWLDGVEGSTLFLARILEQRDYSRPGLQQMLKDLVERNEDIFGAAIALNPELVPDPLGFAPYYFHRDGILTYANLADEQYNYREQPWFADAAATGKPIWVEPYFDEGGGEVLMTTFAVPVYRLDEADQRYLYAVVTADVSLSELRSYLRRLRLGENGNAILLSRAGTILGSRNQGNILRHYSEVTADELDLATWREMFRAALEGQVVSRQLECPALRGKCAIRLGKLATTGWPVGIIYSEQEILAPLYQFQLKTLALGVTTLLLMAAAIYFVTRRITRPLSALARASDQIAHGELDAALPSPSGKDEVARLVNSFTTMKSDLRQYIADLETATATRSRLEGELDAARAIQMSLLPGGGEATENFDCCTLWARVRPARSVGGDLYCYFSTGSQLWIAVGDVSDKGVPAALFMAKAISLVPQLAGPNSTPQATMALLNDALEQGNDNCMFVTLFLAVLDTETGELCFASAGHTPPTLLRNRAATSLEQETGPALGLASGLTFPQQELTLQAGDRLAIFTDGVDEAFNDSGEMFGIGRFNRRLLETGCDPVGRAGPAIFDAIDRFAGGVPQSDDITMMLLQVPYAESASSEFQRGDMLATHVMQWLRQTFDSLAVPADAGSDMMLVVEELITNIDKYAGLERDALIQVAVRRTTSAIEIEVADEGVPFNPLSEGERSTLGADIDSAAIGGLGVHLIAQLTDEQHYQRTGERNILRVAKNLEAAAAQP